MYNIATLNFDTSIDFANFYNLIRYRLCQTNHELESNELKDK